MTENKHSYFELSFQIEEQLRLNLVASAKLNNGEIDNKQLSKFGAGNGYLSREVAVPTITLILLFFFQNWTGFIATVFYGVNIFQVFSI